MITEAHRPIILGQVLNPNAPAISQCIRRIHERCHKEGLSVPSDATIRRYVKRYMEECFDQFTLFRKGKKAWNDACSLSVMRDWSLIEVGDVVIADGHTLNFESIDPATGKAKRMTLLLFFDGRSNQPLGWEIMPTENTDCISAAFRRTCMVLGKMPRVVYIDNGKAFRAKFFKGSKDLQQVGIFGLYESLGVQVVHAWGYHGESKPIERFFGTMLDMEVFVPSYVGNSIANKPARLHRNEKLHQRLYAKTGGRPLTLEETHVVVAKWFADYMHRPSRAKHLKGKTPAEIFMKGRGEGLCKEQLERLDILMMHQTVRTITKNGFKLNGKLYWHEALSSRRHEILVRYDEHYSPDIVKVYTLNGEYLCDAVDRKQHKIAYGVHPMASLLGSEMQKAELNEAIQLKKSIEKRASEPIKQLTESVILPEIRARAEQLFRSNSISTSESGQLEPISMTPDEEQTFAVAQQAVLNALEAQPLYTPSNQKVFKDSQARYEYLFDIQYVQGISLTFEDVAWKELFEKSEEYQKYHKRRFEALRELCA